jgi:hypothetical protein
MPLIQKIEISNFLNLERGAANAWHPRWPHQVFDLGGLNSAMNIPNGKGKSAMVMAILAMLTGDRKELKEVRDFSFAPQRHSHYTHIRIQVLISTADSGGADLLSGAGGEPGGDPMVFGVYGNSGENGELKFYSYQGRFEDCPIAHANGFDHTFVSNNIFRSQLDGAAKLFPSNRQESSDRAWQDHVQTIFDMASLHQQIKYQKLRGGEGGHGYFDVPSPPGANYSASVFYERLAPELLVEGMGELGEEDEHGIEDTIHTKVSQLIVQKHKSEQQDEALRRAGITLDALKKLVESRAGLLDAKLGYDEHRDKLSVEFATLKYVLVDQPIPGVPRIPDESFPLARAMVMQEGKWFLPDRVLAEFTGEATSQINRRSEERNELALNKLDRSQVIDFTWHSFFEGGKRGPAGSLYTRENAVALLGLTGNFTRDWTKQSAIDTLTRAFDWVETHADTNPARKIRKGLEKSLVESETKREELTKAYQHHNEKWGRLIQEQSQIDAQQSAHREMASSGLFTEAELASPEQSGATVNDAYRVASQSVDGHKDRVSRLRDVHASWEAFQREHSGEKPSAFANQLQETLKSAEAAIQDAKTARDTARKERHGIQQIFQTARDALQKASVRMERFQQTAPDAARFIEVFGDVSPVGLANRVQKEANEARSSIGTIKSERSKLAAALEALQKFRKQHENTDPSAWLTTLGEEWDARGRAIADHKTELKEARIRRTGLDTEVVVAGRVAREAAAIAAGNHTPLHAAIESMALDQARRESALTLFSALLHTPVYETAEEAREAATHLEEKRIEAPVFLRSELEAFCRSGEISMSTAFAHTWLVGIRTRQVECLLDPRLVEREKATLDTEIQRLGKEIEIAQQARAKYSPDSPEANLARKAAEAVAGGYEAKDAELATEFGELEDRLPELETRSATGMIAVILAAEKHQKDFADVTEISLQAYLSECRTQESAASTAWTMLDAHIKACEDDADTKQEALNNANVAAMQVDKLRKLQNYMDAPEDNPDFMLSASDTFARLEAVKGNAEARTRFRFDLAAAFIKRGTEYAKEVETQIAHHKGERDRIQDKLLPEAGEEIESMRGAINDAAVQERNIDHLVRNLSGMYRSYTEWADDLVVVSKDAILTTSLGAQTIALHEAQSASERVVLLEQMMGEIDFEEKTGSRKAMNDAKAKYEKLKVTFDGGIDLALATPDADMSEHMRTELVRAKSNPDIVEHLHSVAGTNHQRSIAANEIAKHHLEEEWDKLSDWLNNFTKRLKKNFALLVSVFGPNIDKETKAVLNSGFQISGTVATDADIKAVLDGVVTTIEKAEAERVGKSFTKFEEKKQKNDLRQTIRNNFYQSVITGVGIKVVMPSISQHPLALERKMVSTGQGIAMALLWIVKMAEFTTKRWQNEQASSAAQRKRLRHTQFTLIDGAFSSLSDEGLIKDALDSIDATKGNFQLIITDHDPDYRNNFDYFPTLIVAKEYDGKFMIADKKTRDLIDPASLGLRQGTLGVMSLRAVPKRVAGA